ncbi:hypothetical protein [Micromonospora echinospora]|uniref:hypothetical protein n=1 Tax=Micromonospora echinospora TaxID=1877 RepID=UPI003A8360F8
MGGGSESDLVGGTAARAVRRGSPAAVVIARSAASQASLRAAALSPTASTGVIKNIRDKDIRDKETP